MSIRCDVIPQFAFPKELLTFKPSSEDVGCVLKEAEGYTYRLIYCQLPLLPIEEALIRKFHESCSKHEVVLSRTLRARALRYICKTQGNLTEAIKNAVQTQCWRAKYFERPLTDKDATLRAHLEAGVAYICGRDASFRPILVLNLKRGAALMNAWTDKDITNVLVFVMEFMNRYMFLPGKVETYTILLDMKDVSIMDLVGGKAPKEPQNILRDHYTKRFYKCYVMNASKVAKTIWNVVSHMVLRSTSESQKIIWVHDKKTLLEDIAATQLEEKYGGSMKDWETFYPFPLNPGPFDAGYDGPLDESVPNCHRALARDTSIGHLWVDASLDDEVFKKAELQWASSATTIFATVGIDSPPMIKPRSVKGATTIMRDSLTEGTTSTPTEILKMTSALTMNEVDASSVMQMPIVTRANELSTSLGEDIAMGESKADPDFQLKDVTRDAEIAPAEEVAPADKITAPIQNDEVVASVDEVIIKLSESVRNESNPPIAHIIPPATQEENDPEQAELVALMVKAPEKKPKAKKIRCCCISE